MSPPDRSRTDELRLANELALLPDEARTRVLLGALALNADDGLRRRRLGGDAIAALAATIVAVASLLLTIDQTRTQRKQLAAAVWPSLRVGYSNFEDPEHPKHRLFLANGGVGPARIQSFSVRWHDAPVPHVAQWVKEACPAAADSWVFGTQTGTILPAGGQAMVFSHAREADPAIDRCIHDTMLKPADIRVCYCSALDDCWTVTGDDPEPAPVPDCKAASREVQFEKGQ
ncbi:MAG TPA: hypothetical protein VGI39_27945 [Polyangiaceae bacterium]